VGRPDAAGLGRVSLDFGAHLPLLDFGGHPYTLAHLLEYVRAAADLGFAAVSANDHMIFTAPWLDGPTALAAVAAESGTMTLATSVALPVVRGPVQLAKTLATTWCYITDSRAEADAVLRDRVLPVVHRPEEALRERLPIGSAAAFAEKLAAFRDSGVERVFIWPVGDERRQLELFAEQVLPALG